MDLCNASSTGASGCTILIFLNQPWTRTNLRHVLGLARAVPLSFFFKSIYRHHGNTSPYCRIYLNRPWTRTSKGFALTWYRALT